jgi:hypothetical protein
MQRRQSRQRERSAVGLCLVLASCSVDVSGTGAAAPPLPDSLGLSGVANSDVPALPVTGLAGTTASAPGAGASDPSGEEVATAGEGSTEVAAWMGGGEDAGAPLPPLLPPGGEEPGDASSGTDPNGQGVGGDQGGLAGSRAGEVGSPCVDDNQCFPFEGGSAGDLVGECVRPIGNTDGICGAACPPIPGSCGDDAVCVGGQCAQPCDADDECAPTYRCSILASICVPG